MSGSQTEQERGDDANAGDREHQIQEVDDQVQNSSADSSCVERSQRRNEKSNNGRQGWRFHLRCVKQQFTLKSVHVIPRSGRQIILTAQTEFVDWLRSKRGGGSVALASDRFDFASIDDGDSAVARLYGACVLKGNAGGSDSRPLETQRLAEALLRHLDSRALR